MPGSCGDAGLLRGAFKGSGLRAQGSGLRAQGLGLRGRGEAQKVTFFEVFPGRKGPKKVTFCAGLLRGRGPAQKVTFHGKTFSIVAK